MVDKGVSYGCKHGGVRPNNLTPAESSVSFYKTGVNYALTLNPIDKFQFLGKPNRLNRFRNFIHEQLMNFSCRYEMFLEISEPRGFHISKYAGPRLHLHGTIKFRKNKEMAQFLLLDYYDLLRWASVDIDTVGDLDVWRAYCMKQHLIKNCRFASYDIIE